MTGNSVNNSGVLSRGWVVSHHRPVTCFSFDSLLDDSGEQCKMQAVIVLTLIALRKLPLDNLNVNCSHYYYDYYYYYYDCYCYYYYYHCYYYYYLFLFITIIIIIIIMIVIVLIIIVVWCWRFVASMAASNSMFRATNYNCKVTP